jgi:hypothetical protein
MLKIRLPIQVGQAISATPPQSEERTPKNAAIAPDHHGQAVRLQRGLDRIGK